MTELTDEQKQFLEECEKEFANRYTEDDKDFMQVTLEIKEGMIKKHLMPIQLGSLYITKLILFISHGSFALSVFILSNIFVYGAEYGVGKMKNYPILPL